MRDSDDHSSGHEAVEDRERPAAPFRSSWQGYEYPSTAIVESVSDATGREVTALPALHRAVDADALDALLGTDATPVRLSFRFAGTTVSVDADQRIEVRVDADAGS